MKSFVTILPPAFLAIVLACAAVGRPPLAAQGGEDVAGTDSGPAARFQGYFEHLELEEMASAGLTPMQVIVAATGDAAKCMNVADRVGTLAAGLEADFVVLGRNPLDDIRQTRTIESVRVRGIEVK